MWNVIVELLGPQTTESIKYNCETAGQRQVAAVRVQSKWVKNCLQHLAGQPTRISVVVGLPDGAVSLPALLTEVQVALIQGAHEIALMLDIGALEEGDLNRVRTIIQEVRYQMREKPLSLILNGGELIRKEVDVACSLLQEFPSITVEACVSNQMEARSADVRALRKRLHPDTRIRMISAIHEPRTFEELLAAGASDIVSSLGLALAESLYQEHADRTAVFSRQQGTAGG